MPRTEPRGPGTGPDWGRLIAIVVVTALGSGGTAAFGVNSLTQYRLEQVEADLNDHKDLGSHAQAQRQIDRHEIAIDTIREQLTKIESSQQRQFIELRDLIRDSSPRRRR